MVPKLLLVIIDNAVGLANKPKILKLILISQIINKVKTLFSFSTIKTMIIFKLVLSPVLIVVINQVVWLKIKAISFGRNILNYYWFHINVVKWFVKNLS